MPKLTWQSPGEKYQPIRKVAENYLRMINDGQILSNRESIDIIDARVLALMERIDLEEAPERLKNLYRLWEEFQVARRKGSETEEISVIVQIDAEFEKAYHDYTAWEQMIEVLDLRRKMVDSEVKVIKEMKAFLSVEMAHKMVSQLLAACIDIVKDPKVLRQINVAFSKIIGENKLVRSAEVINAEMLEDEDE